MRCSVGRHHQLDLSTSLLTLLSTSRICCMFLIQIQLKVLNLTPMVSLLIHYTRILYCNYETIWKCSWKAEKCHSVPPAGLKKEQGEGENNLTVDLAVAVIMVMTHQLLATERIVTVMTGVFSPCPCFFFAPDRGTKCNFSAVSKYSAFSDHVITVLQIMLMWT